MKKDDPTKPYLEVIGLSYFEMWRKHQIAPYLECGNIDIRPIGKIPENLIDAVRGGVCYSLCYFKGFKDIDFKIKIAQGQALLADGQEVCGFFDSMSGFAGIGLQSIKNSSFYMNLPYIEPFCVFYAVHEACHYWQSLENKNGYSDLIKMSNKAAATKDFRYSWDHPLEKEADELARKTLLNLYDITIN